MSRLSIVVPVYYNSDTLMLLYEDMKEKILPKIPDYEIVFVDDGVSVGVSENGQKTDIGAAGLPGSVILGFPGIVVVVAGVAAVAAVVAAIVAGEHNSRRSRDSDDNNRRDDCDQC